MREIKFRAWDKENKQMATWGTILKHCDRLSILSLPQYEIMQYTGLKDKNGVEIYEEDILRWYYDKVECSKEVLQVKWGSVGWILKSPLFKRFGISGEMAECSEYNTLGYLHKCEVIGNIYENPQLIEETK